MFDRIEPLGVYIGDTTVPGEGRAEGGYPAIGDATARCAALSTTAR